MQLSRSVPPDAGPGTWTLVVAERIHTLAGPPVEAVVLLGDRVAAAGDARELRDRFRPDATVELDGTVLPGFADAHAHPSMTAENLLHVDCSPEGAPDDDGLVRLLREEAAALDEGSGSSVPGTTTPRRPAAASSTGGSSTAPSRATPCC